MLQAEEAVLAVLHQQAFLHQKAGQSCADAVQQDFQVGFGRGVDPPEHLVVHITIGTGEVDPLQKKDVKRGGVVVTLWPAQLDCPGHKETDLTGRYDDPGQF